MLRQAETLLPAVIASLSNPLVHLNARALGFPAFARWLHGTYAARNEAIPPVGLGRYAAGTLLDGEGAFLVLSEGALVAEQVPGAGEDLNAIVNSLRSRAARAITVDRPCLLACRFGEWTWGHWLLDILPKIVLAERHAPQRFTYAVPFGIVDPSFGSYARSVLDSLAAYGVEPSRLLRIRSGDVYRFDALFDIVGVSGKAMHPGILQAMRDLPGAEPAPRRLTAILRAPPSIRCLVNRGSIADMLAQEGAVFLNPLSTSFGEQAAACRDSDVIIGDLGSNLATIIHARPGTGLVTLAPVDWYDDYFVKLFQRLDIAQGDIRGHALHVPGQAFHHASVVINPSDVRAGLHAVRSALASQAWRIGTHVDGRMVACAPGPVLAEVTFGKAGNANLFSPQSFSMPEAFRTWSLGTECQITMPCPLQGQPLWLEITGAGFVSPPHLVSRPFTVSVNGTPLAEFDIDDIVRVHAYVPAELTGAEELVIDFHHPACPSPQAMGVSSDTRPLGVMFERVALRRLTP